MHRPRLSPALHTRRTIRSRSSTAIGAEVFYDTPKVPGGEAEARFNVGVVLDLCEHFDLLGSVGRAFVGSTLLQGYVAWLVTLGHELTETSAGPT